jgi:hypothetical protein
LASAVARSDLRAAMESFRVAVTVASLGYAALSLTGCAGPPSKEKVPNFVPYFSYEGDLEVKGSGSISTDEKNSENLPQQILSFRLTGVDPKCDSVPEGVGNACGIHIHAGMSCGGDALGHYWNKNEIEVDPWKHVTYKTEHGQAQIKGESVITGLTPLEVSGHTVIVHDHTGARIACGIIGGSASSTTKLFELNGYAISGPLPVAALTALVCGSLVAAVAFAVRFHRRNVLAMDAPEDSTELEVAMEE